jgi:two-component system sensor histidine kinase DegS
MERGDASLQGDPSAPDLPDDLRMRLVEAREAERVRLAQEVHDGPAQTLVNAIFQADYIERFLDSDPGTARSELRFLRESLRRGLDDVRAFISRLRPPLLAELGLNGSIEDGVATIRALTGATIETDLAAPAELLSDEGQVVVLRVVQEALQNVRRHAEARHVRVSTHLGEVAWTLDVSDDGRGFDLDAVTARGRRNFGLQFMRDRAELIGAHVEVQSHPSGGTLVRLTIPIETVRR